MAATILVLADSHGNRARLEVILAQAPPVTHIVHCGDGHDDLDGLPLPVGAELLRVPGNMDRPMPNVRAVIHTHIGGHAVMIAHGHQFQAQWDVEGLRQEAVRCGADIVLFGHTHQPLLLEGVPMLFNPGPANRGMYGLVHLDSPVQCSHHRAGAD